MMRNLIGRLKWLCILGILLAPAAAQAQLTDTPPADIPVLGGGAEGGIYGGGEFLFFRQQNPMKGQTVATRGFVDVDGTITGTPGTHVTTNPPQEALNVNQVSGPGTYEPGFTFNLGYKFNDGTAIEFNWWHVFTLHQSASASLLPPNFDNGGAALGNKLEGTFLFSPVFNFPNQFAGPALVIPPGQAGATFGIWNAAALMGEDFYQRFDQFQIGGRIPLEQTECWRSYGQLGSRTVIMWERYAWRTVKENTAGVAGPLDVADYSNVVSERMYGIYCGWGNEWYWGSCPVGALAANLDVQTALLLNVVKERARYQLGDHFSPIVYSRSRNTYTFVPEVNAVLGFTWYPTQGIEVRLGWDVLAFFNTISSPRPIDFNVGSIDPTYEQWTTRLMNGFRFGISFAF